ncbi:MAG: AAC(3)-I family aminoglycoside N-acetyltransferase [Novosphingobium sp.]|nr:AAC(3)-I family aminoglycoside N-acetyltransferase [Novosphingobium sp.]
MRGKSPWRIVRLGPGDLGRLRALNAMFAKAFDEPDSYRPAPSDEYVTEVLGRQAVVVLAAIAGDAVVGGLVAYELPKLEQARSEFYIYDLAVAQSWRRRGIATALIAETRTIARAAGGWAVFVQADYGDDPAIALYTKLGAREDVMHFDIAP